MPTLKIVSSAAFKANCSQIFVRLNQGEWDRTEVTEDGCVIVVVTAPHIKTGAVANLHGFMRGSVVSPPGIDIAAPIISDPSQ